MKQVPKETTDDALVQEFLRKGGKVSIGKTRPPKPELRLSNICNRPKRKRDFEAVVTRRRVLTYVRPHDATLQMSRARMVFEDRVQIKAACS